MVELHKGKISAQVLAWIPGAEEYVLKCRPLHLKTLSINVPVLTNLTREIPDLKIRYRHHMELSAQQELLVDPLKGARRLTDVVLHEIDPVRRMIFAVEGPNETGLWESADPYSLFTAEYARLCRREGLPTIAYNFPSGNPPGYFKGNGNLYPDEFREGLRAYWAHYSDGLRESDFLGKHEYSAPSMRDNATWECLRYRRDLEVLPPDCRKPIFISEAGIDGGIIGVKDPRLAGWRAFDISEEQYLDQICWYTEEVDQDDIVVAFDLFHGGSADEKWDSFSILGCDLIAAYIAARKETKPMDYQDQFPEQYRAWVEAGGIENNFLKHLLGTGELKPTAEHIKMLASEVGASAAQLQNALNNYPF